MNDEHLDDTKPWHNDPGYGIRGETDRAFMRRMRELAADRLPNGSKNDHAHMLSLYDDLVAYRRRIILGADKLIGSTVAPPDTLPSSYEREAAMAVENARYMTRVHVLNDVYNLVHDVGSK